MYIPVFYEWVIIVRVSQIGFMVGALSSLGSAASAQTVAQYVAATVSGSSTIDTAGIFGPVGSDLSGKKIAIFAQYVPSDFATAIACGSAGLCNLYFNKSDSAPASTTIQNFHVPSSTLIVVNLNEHHIAFAPSKQGAIEIQNNNPNGDMGHSIEIYSDALNSSGSEFYPGCMVSLEYPSTVTFGAALSPTNNPSAQGGSIMLYDPAGEAAGEKSSETLTFTVNQANK